MKYGYARVSTIDQNANLQKDALKSAGCEKVVIEQISGASAKRPKLDKLLTLLSAGDVLTVWRLDRLGRSLPHLIEVGVVCGWGRNTTLSGSVAKFFCVEYYSSTHRMSW